MKSLFDDVLKVSNGEVVAAGPFEADADAPPVVIHWLVVQGDVTAGGVATPGDDRWEDWSGRSQDWKDGPARALGLAVSMLPSGARTFEWTSDVRLKRH